MGDADQYESDENEASTAKSTAGTKYYQVGVPGYYLVAADGSKTSTGSSFVRLGSFPTGTSDASSPTGFANSLALANLVGLVSAITGAETAQDLDPAASANATTPSYKGDSNYLLGFADDTRFRKGEGAKDHTSDWTTRRAETTRLLTKGGWWDHSDGNRISTTVGDKIDIIQGNYKMVVLGRQTSTTPATVAAGALITDISGGLMAENGPSPTHCIKSIEYIHDDGSDTWEVYQNNGIGKVFSSFYGDTVDIFLGQHKATFTGNKPDSYTPDDDDDTDVVDVYLKSYAIRKAMSESLITDDPAVMDHVWASKILDYKRVDGTIKSDVQANNFSTKVYAKFGDKGGGGQIETDTIANTITSTQTAASITSTNFALENFSFVFGAQETIALGPQLNVAIGPKMDVSIAPLAQFSLDRNGFHNLKTEAAASENRLVGIENLLHTARLNIANSYVCINNLDTKVTAQTTHLSQDVANLYTVCDVLAGEIALL